jgi:hypothetical protein
MKYLLKKMESNQHIELVKSMANFVRANYFNYNLIADLKNFPGDLSPPNISGSIPDLYAFSSKEKHYIVGEAKTSKDLKTSHSEKQIVNFLLFLKKKDISSFILSVPYSSADEARWMLQMMTKEHNLSLNECIVFDECDFWKLQNSKWHFI